MSETKSSSEKKTVEETVAKTDTDMNQKNSGEKKQLRLDQFLQLSGIAQTGGHAKMLIQSGEVTLNGEIETRRKRKLVNSDIVEFDKISYPVTES